MKSTMLFILAVIVTQVVGKPVSETTDPTTTIVPDEADASADAAPQPPPPAEDVLLVPQEERLVRVLEELPLEDSGAQEAEVEEVLLVHPLAPEGHRGARCRLIRASDTRYPPSRRRQSYAQRPYYRPYRPFRPRPAYLRPAQQEPQLQIVY